MVRICRSRPFWFVVSLLLGGVSGCRDAGQSTPAAEPTISTAAPIDVTAGPSNGVTPSTTTSEAATAAPSTVASSAGDAISAEPLAPLFTPETVDPVFTALNEDDLVQQMRALVPLLRELRTVLDRTQFDLTDLNFALDFDPARAVDFVRDDISFEPYAGVLRGAQGTLIGRAGNALDQAMLLTALLDEAGYEWRIARGTLAPEDAAALVNQLTQPHPPLPPPGDPALVNPLLTEILAAQGQSADRFTRLLADPPLADPYVDLTEADTRFILNLLDRAGVALGDPDALDAVIAEARDYFWVEYRLDAFDDWQAAHPAFGRTNPPTVAASRTFKEVPSSLYHRLRFEVFVEQKIDDELVVNPVITGLEDSTANLVGRPFVYQNQPNNLDYAELTSIPELLGAANFFLPVVNNQVVGNGFDLDGRIYELELLALDRYGVTPLFQAQARQLEEALGQLDALGDPIRDDTQPDDFITLTAHWIEYTLIAPDGAATTHRRYLLDRIGPDNRDAGTAMIVDPSPLVEAAAGLLTSNTVMVMPQRPNVAQSLDRFAERLLQEAAVLDTGFDGDATLTTVRELAPIQDILLNTVFEAGHAGLSGHVSYRPAPTVVVYQEGITADAALFERVDVVANPRRVFAIDGNSITPSAANAVRAGVWESYTERTPIRYREGQVFNTLLSLREAQAGGIPLRVLGAANVVAVDSLPHSALTKHNLRQQLEAGYVVIVPESPPAGAVQVGWWRVDPATGETLGVVTGNYGGSQVTYFLLFFSIINGSLSTYACIEAGSVAGCCITQGVAFGAGTYGLISIMSGMALAISSFAQDAVAILGGIGADLFSFALPNLCEGT